ncbi:MAG: PaaI family thioesterase [Polyangiales bacterium]
MEARTHLAADPRFCGTLLELGNGFARVSLDAIDAMVVDAHGLVHGGFIFGLADYAAMLAVNDPNVVLAAAETRFLRPVRRGDQLIASARRVYAQGRKHEVSVETSVRSVKVFEGTFSCLVLERHVLEGVGSEG